MKIGTQEIGTNNSLRSIVLLAQESTVAVCV
jgi:hypothetical protein